MPICYLQKDIQLEHLEEKNTPWYEIVEYLANRWRNNKNNLQYLLRLGIQCWGYLVFFDLESQNSESQLFYKSESYLSETLRYGLSCYNNDIIFLCLYGYLISLFPYYFSLTGDYDVDQQFGMNLIYKAHKIKPYDLLTVYLAKDSQMGIQTKHQIKQNISILFPGNSEMDRYFKSVWG